MLLLFGVAVALGALCAALGVSAMRRLALQAQARAARRLLGTASASIDGVRAGDEVTLAGVLSLSGQRALVTSCAAGSEHLRRPALDATTFLAEASVEVCGERVVLTKWVEVLVGSLEDRAERSRAVCPGDRVLVRGTFARTSDPSSSYRDRGASPALIPTHDHATGRVRPVLVAFAGSPRAVGVPWRALLASAAALSLVGWAARAPLLATIDKGTELPCDQRAEALLNAGRPWDAAPLADRCGDPFLEARARWLLGDFGAASRAWQRGRAGYQVPPSASRSEIEAHLIAGDREEAARLLRERARAADTPIDRVGDLFMLADAVQSGGALAPEVRDRFAAWAPAASEPLWRSTAADPPIVDDLHWTVDGRFDLGWTARWPLSLEWARLNAAPPGPHAGTLSERRALASYAVRLGLYHAYLGEHADAMRLVPPRIAALGEALTAAAKADDASPVAHRHSTVDDEAIYDGAAMAALDVGAVALARAYLGQRRRLGGVVRSADAAVAGDLELAETATPTALAALWPGTHLNPYFAVAAHGQGEPLAAMLGAGDDAYLVLPRAVPSIVRGREALVRWTAQLPPPCWTCGVEALVADVARRRAAARALQMYDLERELSVIARKLLAVKLDDSLAPILFGLEQVL